MFSFFLLFKIKPFIPFMKCYHSILFCNLHDIDFFDAFYQLTKKDCPPGFKPCCPLVVIADTAGRIIVLQTVRTTQPLWNDMVYLHILHCNFASTISTSAIVFLINLFSNLFSHFSTLSLASTFFFAALNCSSMNFLEISSFAFLFVTG